MRTLFRHEFETRLLPRALAATHRGLVSMSLIPSVPFNKVTLMIKQAASWCVTVGSGPVCDE
jgi:hypothetical protein